MAKLAGPHPISFEGERTIKSPSWAEEHDPHLSGADVQNRLSLRAEVVDEGLSMKHVLLPNPRSSTSRLRRHSIQTAPITSPKDRHDRSSHGTSQEHRSLPVRAKKTYEEASPAPKQHAAGKGRS